jgi:hypothetical protein
LLEVVVAAELVLAGDVIFVGVTKDSPSVGEFPVLGLVLFVV